MAGTDERLTGFVREALARGIPRAEVEGALRGAGWAPEQVADALGSFADVSFPVPVPTPRPYTSAREAFLYLVLFFSLYTVAYHLASLGFDIIDRLLPDPAKPLSGYWAQSVRFSVSALVVAFPVFAWLALVIGRAMRKDPTKRASRVRKWLTYLTLVVAALALMCDVIALVYNVLGGEATARFVLKVVVVGAIGGTVFCYYLWDLRREDQTG
jgi:Domain of unknown function (DUF5671)